MKFYSTTGNMCYVVKSAQRLVTQFGISHKAGLRAQFVGGSFDSERAQRELNWSDANRRKVERYLKDHVDYGTTLWAEGDQVGARMEDGAIVTVRAQHCTRASISDQGPAVCGAAVVPGTDFCAKHLAEISAAANAEGGESEEPKTAREKTPADVLAS